MTTDIPPEFVADYESKAITSLWTGITALICGMIGPMMCYIPMILSLGLGGWSLWSGYQALSAPILPRSASNCAYGGMMAGFFGFAWSAFFLFIIGMVVVFYVFMIFLAIILGAAGNA